MANWLGSVNWEQIGKTASNVGSAASAISDAANALKKDKVQQNVTNTNGSGSGDTGGGVLLPLLAFLLFKGL